MLIELLQKTVREQPDKTALIIGKKQISFQELLSQVHSYSRRLKEAK